MYRVRIDGMLLDSKSAVAYQGSGNFRYEAGKDIRDILPAEAASDILDLVQDSIASGLVQEMEYTVPVGTSLIDFDVRIVRSGTDEALVIERDVTKRKETERELIRRNFELDSFVYRSSHDLKAPLNSIMGLIGIIQSESDDPVVERYIKLMNKSVTKLDAFIRDLTDFSRNERQELAREPISFASILGACIENLKFMENADRVKIVENIQEEASFYSDPMRMDIILNNLVSNAVKYQNLLSAESWVKIEIGVNTQEAVIRVSDNGIGIKPEHQEKMFELFFRASLQAYGSGLGLYIVKNTVEKLGGEIRLESEYGKGTTFTVSIPNPGPGE
jgi:signal transduction histidine kinase